MMLVCYHFYQVSANLQVNLRSRITVSDACMLSPLPGDHQSTYVQESL